MKQITQTGSIYDVPLNQTLPAALQFDPRVVALSTALAEMLQVNARLIVKTDGIYYRIEELEEKVLDILAADLHADWYDYNGTIEQKRTVIKNNVAIHRRMGTVTGLKTVVESVMGSAELLEWFEYGGEPFYFRVNIDAADLTETEKFEKLLQAISIYKPVRTRLEKVVAYAKIDTTIGVGLASQIQLKKQEIMDAVSVDGITWYIDNDGSILTDEVGNVLCENY